MINPYKLRVGDKVKLVESGPEYEELKEVSWYKNYLGKVLTIKELPVYDDVSMEGDILVRVEENGYFYKTSQMVPYSTPSHKFRVGELVRVKPDVKEGDKGKNFILISDMYNMRGRIYTIKSHGEDCTYYLNEGNFGWGWEEKWLESPLGTPLEEGLFEI
jgi:hypothetical protein